MRIRPASDDNVDPLTDAGAGYEAICLWCKECLEARVIEPGDFCNVHWAKAHTAEPKVCEHH